MANTRCANPEYQLDVDIMMLEYTVYKTIQAQTQNLFCQVDELSGDGSDGIMPSDTALEKREQSIKLQHTCDHLIYLFRRHHPEEEWSAGCEYNVKILEFLVLLEHWLHLSSRTLLGPGSHWMWPNRYRPNFVHPQQLPQSLLDRFNQERMVETVFRRNWLGLRYGSNSDKIHTKILQEDQDYDMLDDDKLPQTSENDSVAGTQTERKPLLTQLDPPNEESPCLNTGIITETKRSRRLEPAARTDDVKDYMRYRSLFSITLFELTPRFMEISADMAGAIGSVSKHWIDLAHQLIWQSALERLQQMPDSQYTKPSQTPFQTVGEDFGIRVWIEECFAWGWAGECSQTKISRLKREAYYLGADQESDMFFEDRLAVEDRISAMFSHSISPDTSSSRGSVDTPDMEENSQWANSRETQLNKLLDLIIEETPVSDNIPFYLSVRKLCEESPIKPFLTTLLQYVYGLFDINASSDISGKPVLIQIEEGGLDGLGEPEFQTFLDRVGLKMSAGRDGTGSFVKWAK